MKTKRVVAAGALSIAICLPGVAIGQGLYVGGAIGSSNFRQGCDGLPAGLSCKKTDSGWKGFAGYQFTPHWGVEVVGAEFGKASVIFFASSNAAGNERSPISISPRSR